MSHGNYSCFDTRIAAKRYWKTNGLICLVVYCFFFRINEQKIEMKHRNLSFRTKIFQVNGMTHVGYGNYSSYDKLSPIAFR